MNELAESPTGCRRTERGAKRCEKVRQAACDLFLEHGYDGVSLDDIIARSGGSKSAIYRHFGGKETLFAVTIEGLCDRIVADLQALDLADVTLEDGLRRLGRTLLKALLAPRHLALYRQVIAQSDRFPGIGRSWTEHGPDGTCQMIARFFEGHRGRLVHVTPDEAARIFHDLLAWDRLNRAVFGLDPALCETEIEKAVDATIARFVQGFVRP